METQTKICRSCNEEKPIDQFYSRRDGPGHGIGLRYRCKQCHRQVGGKIRREVIDALGGRCECCGEDVYEFLAIDHKNGIVTDDDRKFRGGKELARFVKKQGCPKDKYRVLCHNCNMAIGFFGYCPHNKV